MADYTPLHRKLQLAIAAYLGAVVEGVGVVAAEHDDKAPLPRIVVNCDALREVEPASGIFGGTVEITVVTSADDASVEDNLSIAAAAQSELADEAAVLAALNAGAQSRPVSDLHIYELWPSGMRTEAADRSVRTRLDFGVVAMGIDALSPPPPCHHCDSCQLCDACQACDTDPCEACQTCDACQVCDSCDQCDSCQRCDSCHWPLRVSRPFYPFVLLPFLLEGIEGTVARERPSESARSAAAIFSGLSQVGTGEDGSTRAVVRDLGGRCLVGWGWAMTGAGGMSLAGSWEMVRSSQALKGRLCQAQAPMSERRGHPGEIRHGERQDVAAARCGADRPQSGRPTIESFVIEDPDRAGRKGPFARIGMIAAAGRADRRRRRNVGGRVVRLGGQTSSGRFP